MRPESDRRHHVRDAALLPQNVKPALRITVLSKAPVHEYATVVDGDRAELCCIGSKLVKHHGECLHHLSTQHNVRPVNARIVGGWHRAASSWRTSSASGISCQRRWLNSSCVVANDLMRPSRAATNPAISCSSPSCNAAVKTVGEYVFEAVVEFRNQIILLVPFPSPAGECHPGIWRAARLGVGPTALSVPSTRGASAGRQRRRLWQSGSIPFRRLRLGKRTCASLPITRGVTLESRSTCLSPGDLDAVPELPARE